MMRVVSRDVIEHLSQTRVISSERRYPLPWRHIQSLRLDSTTLTLRPFDGLYTELADWVAGWVPGIDKQDAAAIGTVGVNALLGKRTTSTFIHPPGADIPDEQYIAEWTAMLASRIESLR